MGCCRWCRPEVIDSNSSSFGGGTILLVVPGGSDSHSLQQWKASQDQTFCPQAGLSLPSDRRDLRQPEVSWERHRLWKVVFSPPELGSGCHLDDERTPEPSHGASSRLSGGRTLPVPEMMAGPQERWTPAALWEAPFTSEPALQTPIPS